MRGMRRPRPLLVLAGIALLAGLALLVFSRSLDSVVRRGLETYGPRITGTRVAVGGVHLELREGRGELRAVRIGNPDGYSGANALSLGEISLDLDTKGLGREPIVIDEIRVSGPSVLVELDERGAANLQRIREHAEKYVPAAGSGGARPAPRIRVKRFVFEKGSIRFDASRVGGKQSEIALGAVELHDLGGPDGAPADQVATVALRALLRQIVEKAVRDQLRDAARGKLEEKAKDAVGGLIGKLKG